MLDPNREQDLIFSPMPIDDAKCDPSSKSVDGNELLQTKVKQRISIAIQNIAQLIIGQANVSEPRQKVRSILPGRIGAKQNARRAAFPYNAQEIVVGNVANLESRVHIPGPFRMQLRRARCHPNEPKPFAHKGIY